MAVFNDLIKEKKEILLEKIVKQGSKWQVQSEKGRNMGIYSTKAEAEKRLRQIEYFKHLNEICDTASNQPVAASGKAEAYADQSNEKNCYEHQIHSNTAELKDFEFKENIKADEVVFTWYDNNKLVATLSEFDDAYGDRWISYIEVSKPYRNQGLGKQLLDFAVNNLHCKKLGVDKDNTIALNLYKNYGFTIVDENNKQYIMEFNKTISEPLLEDTRNALISQSRNAGPYKDQSRGKNRFERKKYSKVAKTVAQYNKIDMNDFFKNDTLTVDIPVNGETDNYLVTIRLHGVLNEIYKNIKASNNKFEYRTVLQALTKIFNTTDVYTKCNCFDHTFRFSHWNIVRNVSTDDSAHDPGPGKGIRNPNDDKGRGCKHILLVLSNGDWMMKVSSVINNYIHYMEEHEKKLFLSIIFPKLYGIPAEDMIAEDLVDNDKYLDSSAGLINAINKYAQTRGRYKPGSNRNPVTNTGGRQKANKQ